MVENERKGDNSGETGGKDTKKLRVLLCTFGCQMNVRDSEVISGLLTTNGYLLTTKPEEADIVIFNTCSVRQHAENKVWSEIGRIAKRGQSPKGPKGTVPLIGLAGCMAQNYKEEIFKKAPAVDFVVGPGDIDKIPSILETIQKRDCFGPTASDLAMTRDLKIWETNGAIRPEEIYHTGFYEDKDHAYVVISEGCSTHCSYCVVPYVRGELHNRDYNAVLKEIGEAVDRGITRITLLGQNVNAYNFSCRLSVVGCQKEKEIKFVDLLRIVNDIKGLKEFSFMTSHPKDASVDLFKAMAGCDKLKKNLHLPIQSGSNKILKLMSRGYTKEQYLDLAGDYRKIIPKGTLTTDIIVGFPGETEKDFLETYELMKKTRFDAAYLFKYSPRPHTEAEALADDVPKEEKERRHKILLDYQKHLHSKKGLLRSCFGPPSAALQSLAMTILLIFVTLTLHPLPLSYAALDIFDHPRQAEKRQKAVQREAQMNFLDYSNGSFLKGDYEEALKSCRKLLDYPAAQKLKGDISYLAGLSLLKLERFLEARTYFNDIILIEGERADLKRDALLGVGDSYFFEGSFSKACDIYNQILTSYPESEISCIVYYRLGQTLSKMGRDDEAKYYLDKIQRELPLSFEARLLNKAAIEPVNKEGPYSVQVGGFNEKDNADGICEKLVKEGFDAYILESIESPKFRVKVGRTRSKEEAQALESKLKRAGYSTRIYP